MPPPGSKGIGDKAFGRYAVATVVMQMLLMVGGFDVDGGAKLTLVDVDIDIQESDMGPGGVPGERTYKVIHTSFKKATSI